MNIENVTSFVLLNEYKNFQKTANALFISQPTLTYRIKSLEKDLGKQLISRNSHVVKLTEEGTLFLPYAIEISDLYTKAKSRLNIYKASLSICSVRTISLSVLPMLIDAFRNAYPEAYIDIITANTASCISSVVNGKSDIALAEKLDHPDIVSVPAIHDPILLCAARSAPLSNRETPMSLRELSREKSIACNTEAHSWRMIKNLFARYEIEFNPTFHFDSLEGLKASVSAGNCIGFLPLSCVYRELKSGELTSIPIEAGNELYRDICLIYSKKKTPAQLDFLVYQLKKIWENNFP